MSQNGRAKNENPKIKTKKWKTKSARIKGVRPKASFCEVVRFTCELFFKIS